MEASPLAPPAQASRGEIVAEPPILARGGRAPLAVVSAARLVEARQAAASLAIDLRAARARRAALPAARALPLAQEEAQVWRAVPIQSRPQLARMS
jgi:hypothetical protein